MLIDEVCSSNDRCATCVFVVQTINKTNSSNIRHFVMLSSWPKVEIKAEVKNL